MHELASKLEAVQADMAGRVSRIIYVNQKYMQQPSGLKTVGGCPAKLPALPLASYRLQLSADLIASLHAGSPD